MSEFGFATPLGLLGLLALLPLGAAWAAQARRARRADAAYGGDAMLRTGRSAGRTRLRAALLAGAIVFGVVAIARPQWGRAETPVQRQGIDVVIVLDISRSMRATDVAPSRAGAAAAGLREMLRHMGGDRIGLVTFAGSAFARSPLTLDAEAIADLVNRAQREQSLVGPGTDIGAALSVALRLFEVPDPARTRAIVLISDGEDLASAQAGAVAGAQRAGVRIYTVAAGSEAGAAVPLGEGERGVTVEVISRADRASLVRIAEETGGSTRDVANLAGLAVELSRLRQSELDRERQEVRVERLQWPLAAAIGLLVAQTLTAEGAGVPARRNGGGRQARRVAGAGALLLAVVLGACGGSDVYRKVHEANGEYARGRFTQALAAYGAARQIHPGDPIVDYNIGNTLHQLERFEDASEASKAAATNTRDGTLFLDATYAAASHAFRRGALEEARAGFVTVLQRNPEDADARHNLEVVLRALSGPKPPEERRPPEQQPPGAQGTPSAGGPQPGQPGGAGTPQPGGPSNAPPGAGAGSGQPQPAPGAGGGGAGLPPSGAPDGREAELAAEEALRQLLSELPGELTPEDALRVLEAARAASEAGTLQRRGGGAPNPNDR